MAESMIIIGAGVAGLAAGCYARMNGIEASILEQGAGPGGLCASWRRGGYVFDGCIHWLAGSDGEGLLGKYWKELGALEGRRFVYHDVFTRIDTGSGGDRRTFSVYSDADALNAEMKRISPEDAAAIDEFTGLVKKFVDFPAGFDKPAELMRLKDYLAMAGTMKPFMEDWRKYKGMSLADYAGRFSSPHLREGVAGLLGDMPGFSFIAAVMMLSWQHRRSAGYPAGGSLEFARSLERRFIQLGGKIGYGKRVERIIVEKGRAAGVRTADGKERRADAVVSAADGYETIFELLEGKHCDRALRKRYETMPIFEPLFCLSLGVRRDLSAEPQMSVRLLGAPMVLEGEPRAKIGIKHFCFDPALAPAGHSVLQVMYPSDYGFWKALSRDRGAYEAEKAKTAGTIIASLEEFFPGLGADIEEMDAATPLTFERYTSNRRGSFEGWFMSPEAMATRMKKTLPRLRDFYMIGQWVQPGGGLPNSLKSGRDLVYMLCEKRGRRFVSDGVTPR